MPDYKIMVWTKRRALSTGIPYVREAIRCRAWAFASDAVRVYALNNYGGLYMDSDVYVFKSLDKLMTHRNVFFSEMYPDRLLYESEHPELCKEEKWGQEIQAACFASEKGSNVTGALLDYYRNAHFTPLKETQNAIVAPQIFAWTLEHFGYRYTDEEQILADDTIVYPSSKVLSNRRFCSDEAYAVHLCTQSWKA